MSVRRLSPNQPASFAFKPATLKAAQVWMANFPAGRQQSACVPCLWLVQKQGMSLPPGEDERQVKTMKFVPNFLLRDAMGWLLALGLLAALSALFPWELGQKADPFASAPAGIKPEWYFLFLFQTLKYIPAKVAFIDGDVLGVLVMGAGAVLWVIVPFLDRQAARGEKSPAFTVIGWALIVYIVAMTLVGYFT